MGEFKLDNGIGRSMADEEEQYEKGNEGERDTKANSKGGKDGEKMDKAMKKKYPQKMMRGKEYR